MHYRELAAGQKEHKRKVSKMKMTHKKDVIFEETEMGRISVKLQSIMALRQIQKMKRLQQQKVARTPSISNASEAADALEDQFKNSLAAITAGVIPDVRRNSKHISAAVKLLSKR